MKVNGPVLSGDQMVSASQRLSVVVSQGRATIAALDAPAATTPELEEDPAILDPSEARPRGARDGQHRPGCFRSKLRHLAVARPARRVRQGL